MPSYKVTRGLRSHTAHVQEGQPFEVPAKSTLLAAALDHGLDWPYGCRVGLCGQCRCKLLHGQVSELGDHGATLDPASIEQGYILACRSLLNSNILVLPPEHRRSAAGDVAATIIAVARPTPEIMLLTAQVEDPPRNAYHAGQYVRLQVPDAVPPRCFSYANACAGDGIVDFHIRLFPEGRLAEWLLECDRVGARLRLSQPLGEIGLHRAERGKPLLFIAGGTGVAPVIAMLEELAAMVRPLPNVTLVYAARDLAHLYIRKKLDALAESWAGEASLEFCPILSREPVDSDWSGRRGHIFDHLEDLVEYAGAEHAFLCGPAGLVDASELFLLKCGWRRSQISADRFLPAFD